MSVEHPKDEIDAILALSNTVNDAAKLIGEKLDHIAVRISELYEILDVIADRMPPKQI
jgi:hypothetical protein